MTEQMISFLIQCDEKLNIVNYYWNQPLHLLSPFQTNLTNLFDESEELIIKSTIRQAIEQKDVLFCQKNLNLLSPRSNISLCVLPMQNNVLIHGFEAIHNESENNNIAMKELIFNFMKVIKDSNKLVVSENEKMIRTQFEQIQMLNNELLNIQRALTKANFQLNRLNTDLNNRLVKDALTGLVSRYQYRAEMELMIKNRPDQKGVYLFIDIDDFKQINDKYGHRTGDSYLIAFADRLKKLYFDNFICMRISGDEFGIYIHGYENVGENGIKKIWNMIKNNVLDRPIEIEGNKLAISCSIGMSIYNVDTTEIFDLIEYADFAMYIAKKSGKNNYAQFDAEAYRNKVL
jgi:diguanylate cyclase (GGDEF)-like protein